MSIWVQAKFEKTYMFFVKLESVDLGTGCVGIITYHCNITESVDLGTGQMWINKQYPITIEIVDLATGQEF